MVNINTITTSVKVGREGDFGEVRASVIFLMLGLPTVHVVVMSACSAYEDESAVSTVKEVENVVAAP